MRNKATKRIFAALDNKARFVGGCVRNSLLGIAITDIDIATQHEPEETMRLLRKAGINAIPTGIKFGTVTAVLKDQSYEITTLRRDVDCDGRHAQVEYTDDWQEDAARRDFTINAMSADMDGNIYDYFAGQEDLKQGLVRFVGDAKQRVLEDRLRILRFFRFNAYYGQDQIDPDSLAACKEYAPGIGQLSGERISTEMFKLLAAPDPISVLNLMEQNQILQQIIPVAFDVQNLLQLNCHRYKDTAFLRLAAMLNGQIEQDDIAKLFVAWKLSKKQTKFLSNILFPAVIVKQDMDIAQQRKAIRRLGKDIFEAVVRINTTDNADILSNMHSWDIPKFPVSGKDIKAMGIKPGKKMGQVLQDAENWWEEQSYQPSKDDIIDYITTRLS